MIATGHAAAPFLGFLALFQRGQVQPHHRRVVERGAGHVHAAAEGSFAFARYVGGEAGWELVQPAYEFRDGKLISIDTVDRSTPKPSLASIEQARTAVTADGWRYVGGETGWELVSPAYQFHSGKLVSADKFDHASPKPTLASIVQDRNAVTPDGWRHVGGENEWDLVQYAYELRQGQLVHAATCIYGAPGTPSSKIS